jgi:hypothetical protein
MRKYNHSIITKSVHLIIMRIAHFRVKINIIYAKFLYVVIAYFNYFIVLTSIIN